VLSLQPIHVLVLTPWFPNKPSDREGAFIYESALSGVRHGAVVSVLTARPWPAFEAARRGHNAISGQFDPAAFPDFGQVRLVRYASVPGNYLARADAWMHDRTVSRALESMARDTGANLIHVHTEGEAPVAVAVGRKLSIPVVVTVHGINTAPRYFGSAFRRERIRQALAAANRVILVGGPLERYFAKLVGSSENFRIVPNGFRPPSDAPLVPFSQGMKIRFISISNLHEGKGIDVTLEAMAKLITAGVDDWAYVIVGEGPERGVLTDLASKLGLQEKVRFAGACAHDQVYSFLQNADVFVLPSYREAFGIAYLEAMASGLLAIGVEGEGPSAFIRDGETGFLVPPRDSDALAQRMLLIARSRPAMQKIAAAGKDRVTRHFTWGCHAKRLIELYRELLPVA
jgi:glycosyltransferase involved in cell wall biosynthesis